MGSWDDRGLMLDPGLTALALRGLKASEEHYPFLERYRRRRDSGHQTSDISEFGLSTVLASLWQSAMGWVVALGVQR